MRSRMSSKLQDEVSKPQDLLKPKSDKNQPAQQITETGVKQFLSVMRKNDSFQQAEVKIKENDQITMDTAQQREQFTPVMRKSQPKNQTAYDILSQLYELQHRKNRNQSLLDELMRKTKQANDTITFQRIFQRKRYVKRASRCQSVAHKDYELDQVKGQLIQVRAVIAQPHPARDSIREINELKELRELKVKEFKDLRELRDLKDPLDFVNLRECQSKPLEKLLPILKMESTHTPVKQKKGLSPPKKKLTIDDNKFWEIGFAKFILAPSYQESNQLINFSNNIQVIPAPHQKYYKIYVGRGNNHMMIKGLFNLRPQWTAINSLEDDTEVNFIWTQKIVELRPSDIKTEKKPVETEDTDGFLDSKDMELLKQAWDKVEGKTKKKLQEYNLDSAPLLTNLNQFKELTQINHQNQNLMIHNHIRDGYLLGDKKNLFLNLQRFCSQNGTTLWNLIPLTFHLAGPSDEEFSNFQRSYDSFSKDPNCKNIWIVKPGEDTNRGNGIKVSNNLGEIVSHISQQGHTFIVQKYIENPFLYQKRKFDIRCYCLITIINGIKKGRIIDQFRVFWYKKGYLRTSSSIFQLDNLESQKIHLTNDAIQNKMNGYGKFEKGNKISYEQFQVYLQDFNKQNNTNHNFDELYTYMRSITKMAWESVIKRIDNPDQFVGFELYGLDFMVTHNFQPVLIEFNTNPCIETGCPVLAKIISGLIDNLIRFVVDPLFPSKRTTNDDFNSKNNFELLMQF